LERLLSVELLAGEDEALLVDGHALLLLDLGLDVLDLVRLLALDRHRLPAQRLDEQLHPTARHAGQGGVEVCARPRRDAETRRATRTPRAERRRAERAQCDDKDANHARDRRDALFPQVGQGPGKVQEKSRDH